jgi:uncharacterized membrane protein YeiH
MNEPPLLLALDLSGTFVFAVNGALTGLRAAQLDIIGMVTLGMMTAVWRRDRARRPHRRRAARRL